MRNGKEVRGFALLLVSLMVLEGGAAASIPNGPALSNNNNDGIEMRAIDAQGGPGQKAGDNAKFGDTTGVTTVRLPDQDTVVLGGVRQAEDGKAEGGVPVLSKIPLLGRLFRSDSDEKQKQNLMVHVTPTVVSGEEE